MSLPVALFLTFLLLMCLYWAPRIGRNEIHPVAAQTLGVAAVGLVYTLWAIVNNQPWLPYWLFFLAGGLPSLIGLAADALDRRLNSQEARQVLRRRKGGSDANHE